MFHIRAENFIRQSIKLGTRPWSWFDGSTGRQQPETSKLSDRRNMKSTAGFTYTHKQATAIGAIDDSYITSQSHGSQPRLRPIPLDHVPVSSSKSWHKAPFRHDRKTRSYLLKSQHCADTNFLPPPHHDTPSIQFHQLARTYSRKSSTTSTTKLKSEQTRHGRRKGYASRVDETTKEFC